MKDGSLDLRGKNIIVTGAASGIGRAVAFELARRGAAVVAADTAPTGAVTDELASLGGRVTGISADISVPEQVQAMVRRCEEKFGSLSGLVNNAGIFSSLMPKPFEQIDVAQWRQLFEINVYGLMLCCQAAVPGMRRGGGGAIVNISSTVHFKGTSMLLHYVASKGAVIGMTRALARELGSSNIRVNSVAPGYTLSEGVLAHPEQVDRLAEASRAGRALCRDQRPEDVAGSVAFFLSDASAFITGQTLIVDGGSHYH